MNPRKLNGRYLERDLAPYDCASPAVSQNGLARRAAVREAGKSIDVHRRPDTATIWQGMTGGIGESG